MNLQENKPITMIFSLIDPDKEIEIPAYTETDNRKGYTYWGPDNKFPNQLMELSRNSVTLTSIINGTTEMIKGEDVDLNPRIHEKGDLYYWPYINKDGETINDLREQCTRDYMHFGMFAIQIVYNKIDNIAELYCLPAEFIRMNEDRSTIWFSRKFGKWSSNAVQYAKFDRSNIVDHKSQIFIYTNSGKRQVYGISPQTAALEDVISESYAAKYVRKSLQNGLAARYLIDLPNTANLPDDQKASIEEGIRDNFTGWQNAGEFALYFNNSDKEMKITKVDRDDSNEVFKSIRDAARNNIFVVNHATPNLFGDPSSTTGFNSQEYAEAFNLYDKMTLQPIKRAIANSLDRIFGMDDTVVIKSNTTIANE